MLWNQQKQLCKYLPLSVELQHAVVKDETTQDFNEEIFDEIIIPSEQIELVHKEDLASPPPEEILKQEGSK